MLFWKSQTEPFAEAKTARKSVPVFITMLLAGVVFFGFTILFYFLYDKLYEFIQNEVAYLRIDAELPVFYDLDSILKMSANLLLVPLAVLYVRFLEGRRAATMGFHKKDLAKGIVIGAAIGAVLFGVMLALLAFTGSIQLSDQIRDDALTRIACILSVILGSAAFELYFRGFVLSSLGSRGRALIAVLLTAVLSTAAQSYFWGYSALSIFNNILFSVFLGLVTLRTGTAYTACALRAVFLFVCQFVFGVVYSGSAYAHSLVPFAVNYQSGWAGTAKGIDSGFIFTLVVLLAVLLALFIPKREPKEEIESGPFFKHVPVEPKTSAPSDAPASVPPAASKDGPVLRRSPLSDEKTVFEEDCSDFDEDEDWEEEEMRAHVDPDYKDPKDYLK